jgi:predicted AlkP superfamily phosphohydrolase/phosphomutase/Tfp pilus assembly protein PilF
MRRSRFYQAVSILAGLAAITYLLISLYLPSGRWFIFGIDKKTGRIRMVQQSVTFLPPYEYYRMQLEKRDGWAQSDDFVDVTSKEGVTVKLTYRLRFGMSGDSLPDASRIVNQGWKAWTRARVAEAVTAVASQIPIEELISPTSQFNSQRDPLRQAVTRHLASVGLKVTAFNISKFDVDRTALLNAKRTELRRDARSTPSRVVVFAIDGADWELLSELADDGRIPNIKALTQGGTTASPQTVQPTISPTVWTTVATGLTPDRHGVLDYTDPMQHSPVDAYSRRVPAVWDIANAFARTSHVTNWWTAWPPSSADGVVFDTPVGLNPNAVFPAEVAPRAQSLVAPLNTVNYDQVHRFLNISPAEYDAAVNSGNANDPVNIFRGLLAKTWSDHRVAINLYNDARQRGREPLLTMVSYDGTDAVNHLFAPFHPPLREDVSEVNYRKYWPAVGNYYAEIDRLIGEWMNVLPKETTVIVVSAYGFRWGKNRPHEIPSGRAALSDHRNTGIFIAYGPAVAPSRASHQMSVYDVAPTILGLLGLPKSLEMPGNVATWAFRDLQPLTSVRVVSYGEFVGDRPIHAGAREDLKQYQAALQAIGHLNDPNRNLTPVLEEGEGPARAAAPLPPEKWGTYAYYNNLGVELRGKGKLKEASEAFEQAVELNPERPAPYLNLAMAYFDRQFYTDADETFFKAVAKGLPNAEAYIIDFAALYRERNMVSRAIGVLAKGKELFPQSYLISANLGSAMVAASRYTEGVPELERALGMQPSSTLVLNNLGIFYAKKNDYARALDYWNRSLSIQPQQPGIRQAVEAARTRL